MLCCTNVSDDTSRPTLVKTGTSPRRPQSSLSTPRAEGENRSLKILLSHSGGKSNNNNNFVLYLISMYKYSWLNILKGMEQICPPCYKMDCVSQSRSPDVSCGLRLPSAAGLVSLLNHNSGARPARRNASLSSRRHFRRFNLLLLFLDASIA